MGTGLSARQVRRGDGTVCLLAVGKMVEAAEEAAGKLAADGVDATVWDVRVVSPPDPAMLADAAAHGLVVTMEDGIRVGGAGTFLVDAMRGLTEIDHPLPPVCVLGVPRPLHPPGQARRDPGRARPGRARHRHRGDPGARHRARPPLAVVDPGLRRGPLAASPPRAPAPGTAAGCPPDGNLF